MSVGRLATSSAVSKIRMSGVNSGFLIRFPHIAVVLICFEPRIIRIVL